MTPSSPPLTAAELADFLRDPNLAEAPAPQTQIKLERAAAFLDSLDAMEKALEAAGDFIQTRGAFTNREEWAHGEIMDKVRAVLSSLSTLKGKT